MSNQLHVIRMSDLLSTDVDKTHWVAVARTQDDFLYLSARSGNRTVTIYLPRQQAVEFQSQVNQSVSAFDDP